MTPSKPETLALALNLDRLMRRLHCTMRQRAEVVDRARIGPFGAMTLVTIVDLEPLPIQSLARHLSRDKGQITRTVKMLEEVGLVRRTRSTTDRRVWFVELTDKGHAHVASYQELLTELVEGLVSGLDEGERLQFSATLAKMLSSTGLEGGS